MKKIIPVLLLLLSGTMAFAQLPEKKFEWSEDPLKWEDFMAVPDADNPFDANTNSGISYSWSMRSKDGKIEFLYKVETYFYPTLSWVKPGKDTPGLLAHEQVHFDITEIHGRKLRKIMEQYKPDSGKDIKKELQGIYQDIERSRDSMQKSYDQQTDHGRMEAAQRKWEQLIKSQLRDMKKYAS